MRDWTWEELRDVFQARGYHKTPLSVERLDEKNKNVLLQIMRTLMNEREEDAQVRERLLARNQELERRVQTTQRTTKHASDKTQNVENRLHTIESRLQYAAHKATREQLGRARKQMLQMKAATAQHRTATDRRSERLRERMTTLSLSNLKALVPDIRIASPAFVAKSTTPEAEIAEQQLSATEQKNLALMDATHALKKLAADALTSLHQADVRLQKIIEVEVPHEARGAREGGEPQLAQLFPPLRPLVVDDTEETHPARKRLHTLSRALQEHVAQLSQWAALSHVRSEYTPAERGAAPVSPTPADLAEVQQVEADLLLPGKRRRVSES